MEGSLGQLPRSFQLGRYPRHPRDRCCRKLAFPVNDPAFCQIVRREFNSDAIPGNNADKVLPHPTGDVGHNDVSTFDLNAKTGVGQGLRHDALDLECFFLLFCHTRLCPVNKWGDQRFENAHLLSRPCDWPNPIILASAGQAGPAGLYFAGETCLAGGGQTYDLHGPIVAIKWPVNGVFVAKTPPFYAYSVRPAIIQFPRLRYS